MISIDVLIRIIALLSYLGEEKKNKLLISLRELEKMLISIKLPKRGIELIAAFIASYIHLRDPYYLLSLDRMDYKKYLSSIVFDILDINKDLSSHSSKDETGIVNIVEERKFDTIFEHENAYRHLLKVIASGDIKVILSKEESEEDALKEFIAENPLLYRVIVAINNLDYITIKVPVANITF
jgi:hypothetical protein